MDSYIYAGAIKQLEKAGLPLTPSLAIVNNAREKIAMIPGKTRQSPEDEQCPKDPGYDGQSAVWGQGV